MNITDYAWEFEKSIIHSVFCKAKQIRKMTMWYIDEAS